MNQNKMKYRKQVDKDHYRFDRYMLKERWISVWHQLDEVVKLKPASVLEIGPGPGVFKAMAVVMGLRVETLDLDPELKPDHVGSSTAIPLADATFDVVCAFQMLEHLPYKDSLQSFHEMVRVSRSHVLISVPDAKPVWSCHFHVPRVNTYKFLVPHPFRRPTKLEADPEHCWEINRPGYPLSRIVDDFSQCLPMVTTFRVHENPYHRFLLFSRQID